jgi:Ser-tRNA(Ala) deacylase AlaX
MHTAEHLLTATMWRLHGSPRNLEMHLGEAKTKCDYEVGRPFGDDDARAIETAVNAEIARDHRVSVMHITRAEAEARFDLWKVPPGAETIRVVTIGDVDATPCSGDHVAHTREIGRLMLRSFEMRSPTIVRIRFGLENPDTPWKPELTTAEDAEGAERTEVPLPESDAEHRLPAKPRA